MSTTNAITHPNGQTTVVGSTVQFTDDDGVTHAGIVIALYWEDEHRLNLHVYPPLGGAGRTVIGAPLDKVDVTTPTPGTWRPLPIAAAPVAEFPVAQFVDAVKPIVETAAAMAVEDALKQRDQSAIEGSRL